jgi:hypothetical protein
MRLNRSEMMLIASAMLIVEEQCNDQGDIAKAEQCFLLLCRILAELRDVHGVSEDVTEAVLQARRAIRALG